MLNVEEGSRVKISKVDCTTSNELCSEQEVTGYPTLKFFKVGESESVKFRGTRDLPTLTSFISEQLGDSGTPAANEDDDDNLIDDLPKPIQKQIELNEDNFSSTIAAGKHFIKFYAPWCGHCQKLAPVWDDLFDSLEHDISVSISKIDCTKFRPICQDFEVKGYPTLLWIEDGKKVEKYAGARNHVDLKKYVEKMAGKTAATVKEIKEEAKNEDGEAVAAAALQLTGSDFEHGIENGVTFVKFFAPWCGHCKRLAPTWDLLASKFVGRGDIKIAKVDCTFADNKELCSQQEVDGFPTLFIYKNGEKASEYNGSRSLDDLYDFVTRHAAGTKDEL